MSCLLLAYETAPRSCRGQKLLHTIQSGQRLACTAVVTCVRIILEEDMVQGTKLKHSIWVIHPARLWRDVELRVLCSCLVQSESEICSSIGSRNLSQQSATTCSQLECSLLCALLCCNACSSTEGKSARSYQAMRRHEKVGCSGLKAAVTQRRRVVVLNMKVRGRGCVPS